eukprot:30836-Pelagococcus_subviridis.AAC.3
MSSGSSNRFGTSVFKGCPSCALLYRFKKTSSGSNARGATFSPRLQNPPNGPPSPSPSPRDPALARARPARRRRPDAPHALAARATAAVSSSSNGATTIGRRFSGRGHSIQKQFTGTTSRPARLRPVSAESPPGPSSARATALRGRALGASRRRRAPTPGSRRARRRPSRSSRRAGARETDDRRGRAIPCEMISFVGQLKGDAIDC